MKRFAAWLVFLLACAAPGWLLRDIVAAEAQLRVGRPVVFPRLRIETSGQFGWGNCIQWRFRRLGYSGQEHLWDAWMKGGTPIRRARAALLLDEYDHLDVDVPAWWYGNAEVRVKALPRVLLDSQDTREAPSGSR